MKQIKIYSSCSINELYHYPLPPALRKNHSMPNATSSRHTYRQQDFLTYFTNPSDTLVNVQSDTTKIEFTMTQFANLKSRRLYSDFLQEPQSTRKAEAYTISPKVQLHTWLHRKTSNGVAPIVSIKKGQTTMPNEKELNLKTHTSARDTTTGRKIGMEIFSASGQPETQDSISATLQLNQRNILP